MEEADHSGSGEHAAGGVPESGDAAEDDGVPVEVGGGVPAVAGGGEVIANDTTGGEAAIADGVPTVVVRGEAVVADGVRQLRSAKATTYQQLRAAARQSRMTPPVAWAVQTREGQLLSLIHI